MTVYNLIAEALVGKYIKDYQCLYYITEASGCNIAGIEINPELMCPVNMEWYGEVYDMDSSAQILTREEFMKELDKSLSEIKTKITDEFIKKQQL